MERVKITKWEPPLRTIPLHQCPKCPHQSSLLVNLTTHIRTVHETRPPNPLLGKILKKYTCRKCHFYSYSVLMMTKHVYTRCRGKSLRMLDRTSLKCPQCPYEAKKAEYLRSHRLWKHADLLLEDIRWFECEHCPFRSKEKRGLKRHILTRHTCEQAVKWFQCEQCPFRARLGHMFKKHVSYVHARDNKWLKCDQCVYITPNRATMDRHTAKRHPNRVGPRTNIGKILGTKPKALKLETLIDQKGNFHVLNSTSYRCPRCTFETDLKVMLSLHCNTIHRGYPLRVRLSKILKEYKCTRCSFSTYSLLVMTRHHHHGCHGRNTFKCPHCPFFEAKTRRQLENHLMYKHTDPGEVKWHKCDQCPYKSRESTNLRQHQLLKHTSEEEVYWFQCDRCSYRTKLENVLERHMYVVHTSNWFKCGHCLYKSPIKDSLEKHIAEKHSSETINLVERKKKESKRFGCNRCEFKTDKIFLLQKHLQKEHSDLKKIQ